MITIITYLLVSFAPQGGIGLNVAQMIVELIRDKRKIVDRINQTHVQNFIQLLRHNQVSPWTLVDVRLSDKEKEGEVGCMMKFAMWSSETHRFLSNEQLV